MGGYFSKTFNPETDIPSLTDRTAIVTGANTGLGYQTALALASHGAKVYVGSRSEVKGLDAIKRMEAENKELVGTGRLVLLQLDLESIKKAKAAAEEFLSKETRLDLLVNNAAVGPWDFTLTEEGFEQGIATNHLGHFVFTTTLLPVLNSTAKLDGSDVRVINISSAAYTYAPKDVTFSTIDEFKKPWAEEKNLNAFMIRMGRYGLNKLANILFTNELQQRWDNEGIPAITISLHPGTVATDGAKRVFANLGFLGSLFLPFSDTPKRGATTSLFAAASPEVKANAQKYKAQYLVPYAKIQKKNEKASDPKLAALLWKTSEEIVADVLSRS